MTKTKNSAFTTVLYANGAILALGTYLQGSDLVWRTAGLLLLFMAWAGLFVWYGYTNKTVDA